MSRYAVKILVRNLGNEGGDDSDDAIVNAEIIADSAEDAAHLRGELTFDDWIGPERHSVRSELH